VAAVSAESSARRTRRGAPSPLGRLLKQWLRLALTWGRKRGRVAQDVVLEVSQAELPAHKHKHQSPLNPADIANLWRALDDYQAKDTAIGIRLLLLLFVRPTELREARWPEFEDGATWRIPGPRTKMRTPHVVPLSPEVQKQLDQLRDLTGNTPILDCMRRAEQTVLASQSTKSYVGAAGRGPGEFLLPSGLYIDKRDRIYVADQGNSRVQVFQYVRSGPR